MTLAFLIILAKTKSKMITAICSSANPLSAWLGVRIPVTLKRTMAMKKVVGGLKYSLYKETKMKTRILKTKSWVRSGISGADFPISEIK
jgi:hypothetical protein